MKKLIICLCMANIAVAQAFSAAAMSGFTLPMKKPTTTVVEHAVGPCHFTIANMFGGEFKVSYPKDSPPHQGSYHFPIIGPGAFISDGFGIFCMDANEDSITTALNAKYIDGKWLRYGPVNGPDFVPFEKQANARTVPLKGANWTGMAYTEDDTTGDERRRARVFHFCLIHNAHALCGNTPVKWLADRKTRSDLDRIKAILESVQFVDTPTPAGSSAASGATTLGR